MLHTYNIADTTPLEIDYQPRKLIYLTLLWRAFQSFDNLEDPRVELLDNTLYLANGNHRAMWLTINGIGVIDAKSALPPTDYFSQGRYRQIAHQNHAQGIWSPEDLARRIATPEHFFKTGKLPKGIKKRELKNPRFMEQIDLKLMYEL